MFDTSEPRSKTQSYRRPLIIVLVGAVVAAALAVILVVSSNASSGTGSAHATNGGASGTNSSGPTPTETTAPHSPDPSGSQTSPSDAGLPGSGTPGMGSPGSVGAGPGGRGAGGSHSSHPVTPAPVAHFGAVIDGAIYYRGVCPATIEYVATVTASHVPADLQYRWTNGVMGGVVQTAHLTTASTRLFTTVRSATSTAGSISFQTLTGTPVTSNFVDFTMACTVASVGPATVSPTAFTGSCVGGHTFTFRSSITVTNGPADVHYRWIGPYGTPGPVQTLSFGVGTSTQVVTNTWVAWPSHPRLTAPETVWTELEVLDPFAAASSPATFYYWCT